jgi:hypothetical protein
MVGGGRDAFIGGVHRIASPGSTTVTSWSPARSPRRRKIEGVGADLGVAPDRAYGDFARWRSARRG